LTFFFDMKFSGRRETAAEGGAWLFRAQAGRC
jgi:hypothetical protein